MRRLKKKNIFFSKQKENYNSIVSFNSMINEFFYLNKVKY